MLMSEDKNEAHELGINKTANRETDSNQTKQNNPRNSCWFCPDAAQSKYFSFFSFFWGGWGGVEVLKELGQLINKDP